MSLLQLQRVFSSSRAKLSISLLHSAWDIATNSVSPLACLLHSMNLHRLQNFQSRMAYLLLPLLSYGHIFRPQPCSPPPAPPVYPHCAVFIPMLTFKWPQCSLCACADVVGTRHLIRFKNFVFWDSVIKHCFDFKFFNYFHLYVYTRMSQLTYQFLLSFLQAQNWQTSSSLVPASLLVINLFQCFVLINLHNSFIFLPLYSVS